jgi:hypothetical protein
MDDRWALVDHPSPCLAVNLPHTCETDLNVSVLARTHLPGRDLAPKWPQPGRKWSFWRSTAAGIGS